MWTLLTLSLLTADPVPAAVERIVVVVPYGEVDPLALDAVKQAVEAKVNATVRVDPVRPLPPEAFWKPRKRWRAEKLLDPLEAAPPQGAWKVIAVTAAEIFTTKGNIEDWGIAGLGHLGGRACVVSTYLYKKHSKSQSQWLKRFRDVAVHELGHTLGMNHCETQSVNGGGTCVMADAKGKALKSADASSGQYCEVCRALVEKGALKP